MNQNKKNALAVFNSRCQGVLNYAEQFDMGDKSKERIAELVSEIKEIGERSIKAKQVQ